MKNTFKQIYKNQVRIANVPLLSIALAAIIGFSLTTLSLTGCDVAEESGPPKPAEPIMRTVTFDANGGTVEGEATKAVQVENGERVTLPTDPVFVSKFFWGWFDNQAQPYGNIFTGTIPITADKTVYARWGVTEPPAQFDVTFNANGGKFADGGTTQVIKVYPNETVIPPYATRDGGYLVSGWNSQANGSGTVFDKDTPITADKTVYAQWKKPEEMQDKDRWDIWRDSSSSATLVSSSIDDNDDGSCIVTATIGGTTEKQGQNNVWRAWTITAEYYYTGIASKNYVYTFEAWTDAGTRDLNAQYYEDNNAQVYLGETVQITNTRKTYTVIGQLLPKGGLRKISFQLANQTGTVHIKIVEIKEFNIGKLTITNFSGNPGLTQGMDVYGTVNDSNINLLFCTSLSFGEDYWNQINVTIRGNTITIPVWKVDDTVEPYTGNIIVPAGHLLIEQWNHTANWEWTGSDYYINKVPITFTNGNASINFATQMQLAEDDSSEENNKPIGGGTPPPSPPVGGG